MTPPTGAWIGVAAGLVLAMFEYWLVLRVARQNTKSDDPEVVDQKLRPLKTIMSAGFVVLPIFGYVLGNMLVEQGLLPR